MIGKLSEIQSEAPVVIFDPVDDSIRPLTSVYHEPPHTFIQSHGKSLYSIGDLISKLEKLASDIPFDAQIVSGDDWNYQEIDSIAFEDNALVISLSKPNLD